MCFRTALILGTLATAAMASASEDEPITLKLRLQGQADAIWSALPVDAADARLARLDDAPAECVTSALAEARRLLGQGQGARAALREVSLDLAVPRGVADRLSRDDAPPSLLAPFVTSATRGAQVAQPLGDTACGAYYDLRGADGEPGGLALTMQVEAGCGCTQQDVRLHLLARAPVTPGATEKKGVLLLRAGAAAYEVLAACEPCDAASGRGIPARVPLPAGDACGNLCAPLAQGLTAWQRKVDGAAARVADLAGKATTLELQVTTDRRELAAAESARSRTRTVLEKISALQARIKAAQAELARVRQASEDAGRLLSGLRRAASDTESAEGRCRAQCQAGPPRADQASATGSGGAAAGGGGISAPLLIGGGAVLAGGAVALAAGGGSNDPAAAPDFSGLWRGTRVVISNVGAPELCRRVYDETWRIRQDGSTLTADVMTTTTDCGIERVCQAGCSSGTFPREQHPGTASGNTASFYVYLSFQIPSCVLPLTLQGSTLRGFMPACMWNEPLPVSHEVTLQRVTP